MGACVASRVAAGAGLAAERRRVRWFRFFLVASLAVLVQTTVVRVLSVRGARPDLMVAVLVAFSLGLRRSGGFAVGCLTGLLRDLFSLEPLGLGTGSFAVLGYLVARGRAAPFANRAGTHVVAGLLCSLASSGVSVAALAVAGRAPSLSVAAGRAVGTGLLTAGACWVLGRLVWRWRRWFGLRRGLEFDRV